MFDGLRRRTANRLERIAANLRATKYDPYACQMCGVVGTGACGACGSGGCDNGCRSPWSEEPANLRPSQWGAKCDDCGAQRDVWTHYGGEPLARIGPPKVPFKARFGWRQRVGNPEKPCACPVDGGIEDMCRACAEGPVLGGES